MERKATLLFALLAAVLLSIGISAQGNVTNAFNAIFPATSVNWTVGNNPITYGDTQVLTATPTGGIGPYTYNFLVYNASGALEFNAMFTDTSASSYSFGFQQLASWGTGNFLANITILDGSFPGFPLANSLTYLVQPNTTTTSSTTSSTTVPVTLPGNIPASGMSIITHNVISVAQNASASLVYQNGMNLGRVLAKGNAVRLVASRSVLKEVDVGLSARNLTMNISIKNQSQVPVSFTQPATPVYQFFQINGSVANSTNTNIDQYVTGATYNFSVPVSWVQSKNASSTGIALYKYLPDTQTWESLPTMFTGANLTSYFYSATSPSFSAYIVSFTVSNTLLTTTQVTTLNVGTANVFTNYFFVSGYMQTRLSAATFTTNFIKITSNTVHGGSGASTYVTNVAVIGYNTFYNGNIVITSGGTYNTVMAGIGANVIYANRNQAGSANTVPNGGNSLTFCSGGSCVVNSVAFLLYGLGGNYISSVTLPAGCTLQANTLHYRAAGAAVANCILGGAGPFTTAFVPGSTTPNEANAIAAIVFPPYTVTLSDNPTTGNILTNNLQQASGNTISVIGMSTINAVFPASYTWNSWYASAAGNFIIANALAPNTVVSVEGFGTITASYNSYATLSTPVPTNVVLDAGQYVVYNTIISNGDGPFTVNLINTGTSAVVNTIAGVYQGTVTFKANVPAVGNPVTFNVVAVDNGQVVYTFNSVPNSIIVYADPTVSITPVNTVIDAGQYFTATTSASGGGGSFTTYNFLISNSITNTVIASQVGASSTAAILTNSLWATNSPINANVLVTDTGVTTPFIFNSIEPSVTVHSAQTTGLLTESNTIIDVGQYSSLTAGATSGGTSPFTYNWFANGACTQPSFATGTTALVNPSSTTTYSFNSADSASTKNVVCSVSNTVGVNSVLVAGLLTATSTLLDAGQYTTLTSAASGGTAPYTINWFSQASCAGGSVATGTAYTINPGSTTTYSYNVVDSATTKNVMCSGGNTITVRTAPTLASLIPTNVLLDSGQYVVYNVILTSASGGSSFTVNLINTGTGALAGSLSGQSSGTLAFTKNQPATGTQTYVVVANDLTPTAPYGFSSGTNVITVNSAMAPQISSTPALPATLNVGTSITFNAQTGPVSDPTGQCGTPPSGLTILYCRPLTFNNGQGTAVATNTPIMIPFNALKDQTYLSGNVVNIFVYNDLAGTTAPLYLEGNVLDETQGANLNAVANEILWAKIPDSIGASSSDTNWNMGYVSTSTNLLGNAIAQYGEAPQLSGTYGQYDNGANVFKQYGGGGAVGWSQFTYVGGTWSTANGYLQQTASSGSAGTGGPSALIESVNYPVTGSYILEMIFSYTTNAVARIGLVAAATPVGSDAWGYRFIGQQSNNGAGFLSFLNDMIAWVYSGNYLGSVSTPYTMSITDAAGTWSGSLYSGYGFAASAIANTLSATAYTTNNFQTTNTGYVGISAAYYNGVNTIANPINVQWFRMRTYPPGGVMPSVTFGSLTAFAPVGGQPPYTYNFIISNTVTNAIVAYQLYSNVYSTANSYLWTIPSNMGGNTLNANIIITDSASTPVTANSIDSNMLTVTNIACFTSLDNSIINFGSINPGISVNTNNGVQDTNAGGNTGAYIYVYGGNWLRTVDQVNGFGISNTSWAASSGTSYASANRLGVSASNTFLFVPAGGSNTVYFGLRIPPAATATSYSQNIIVLSSC